MQGLNKLTAVLVDDEPDARRTLALLLQRVEGVEVVGEANCLHVAKELILGKKPDLVFLDIQLDGENGFQLFDLFPVPEFSVIFCTAYDQYAIQAIRKGALDYLMKPVDPDELLHALEAAKERTLRASPRRLAVRSGEEIYFVDNSNIFYIKSDGPYASIHLTNGKRFVQVRSLREFEEVLPDHFLRIHQSFLVNMEHVVSFHPEDMVLELKDPAIRLPVSRRRKTEVLKFLGS